MKNRDVTSTLMGITMAQNMYRLTTNFFQRAWRDAQIPVIPISYILNAAMAICAPLAKTGRRWTALGVLIAIWSACGVFYISDRETKVAPGVPGVAGPGVAAVLGALIAVFGPRAYGGETALGTKRWISFR